MPVLLRSKEDIRQALGVVAPLPKKPSSELGAALRQLLEVEQDEMLRALRAEILEALQNAVSSITVSGQKNTEQIDGLGGDLARAHGKAASDLQKAVSAAVSGVEKAVGAATGKLISALEKAVLEAIEARTADVVHAVVELRNEVLAKIEVKPGKPTSWTMNFDRGIDNRIKTPVTFKPE